MSDHPACNDNREPEDFAGPFPWHFGRTTPDKRMVLDSGNKYVCEIQIWQTPRNLGSHDESRRAANAELIQQLPEIIKTSKTRAELLHRAHDALHRVLATFIPSNDGASGEVRSLMKEIRDAVGP